MDESADVTEFVDRFDHETIQPTLQPCGTHECTAAAERRLAEDEVSTIGEEVGRGDAQRPGVLQVVPIRLILLDECIDEPVRVVLTAIGVAPMRLQPQRRSDSAGNAEPPIQLAGEGRKRQIRFSAIRDRYEDNPPAVARRTPHSPIP